MFATLLISALSAGRAQAPKMRTLLIENDDSFTMNGFHIIGDVNGEWVSLTFAVCNIVEVVG